MAKYKIDIDSEGLVVETGLESQILVELTRRAISAVVGTEVVNNSIERMIMFTKLDVGEPTSDNMINMGATFAVEYALVPATVTNKQLIKIISQAIGKV